METDPLVRGCDTTCTTVQNNYNYMFAVERTSVICILITVLCERLAYYSVLSNLILYCTSELMLSPTEAAIINLLFAGSVFIVPLFGYIADVSAGKYNTIIAAGLMYIIGLILLFGSAADYKSWFKYNITLSGRRALFYSSLVLVTLGAGGIRCNIGPLGAQQLESHGSDSVRTFFNWLYWFVNFGAIVAQIGVAYVQESYGFGYGYAIPLLVILMGLVAFRFGKNKYKNIQEKASPFKEFVGICYISRCGSLKKAEIDEGGKYSHNSVVRFQMFIKLIPMCALFIVYFSMYAQVSSTFFLQSERLDISIGSGSVPLAYLHSFDNIIILILIPVMQIVFYPMLKKSNRNPSLLQRIGFGMILATLSVGGAGLLEIYRKQNLTVQQTKANSSFNASSVSVFAQIPQFTLFGTSEVFTSVSGMELVYVEAPDLMKSICMGIYLETAGLGQYLALLILEIVKKIKPSDSPDTWFPNDLEQWKDRKFVFPSSLTNVFKLSAIYVFCQAIPVQ